MAREIDRAAHGVGDPERNRVVAGAGAAHESPEVADDAAGALDLKGDAVKLGGHEVRIDGTTALGGLGQLVAGGMTGEVDHLQRLAELVRHRGRHFADSGETLGGEQGVLGLAPLGFVDFEEGDLAHHPRRDRDRACRQAEQPMPARRVDERARIPRRLRVLAGQPLLVHVHLEAVPTVSVTGRPTGSSSVNPWMFKTSRLTTMTLRSRSVSITPAPIDSTIERRLPISSASRRSSRTLLDIAHDGDDKRLAVLPPHFAAVCLDMPSPPPAVTTAISATARAAAGRRQGCRGCPRAHSPVLRGDVIERSRRRGRAGSSRPCRECPGRWRLVRHQREAADAAGGR